MVGRVPSILRNTADAPLVRVRRGREGHPEFPHDRGVGQGPLRGEPDAAEVRKLARELAAEFGREHIIENFRVKSTEPVLITHAVAVEAVPGNVSVDNAERSRGPRVLKAVESTPGQIPRQSFFASDDYHPAPGNPASGNAPRGNVLNFHA